MSKEQHGEERRRCARALVRGSNEKGGWGNRGVGGGGTKTNCTMSHLPNFDKTKILFPYFFYEG